MLAQKDINKYFESSLGQQLDILYSTSDDKVFIRFEEALDHGRELKDEKIKIFEWYREEKEEENEWWNDEDYWDEFQDHRNYFNNDEDFV